MQQFNFPTVIYYGEGALSALAAKIAENKHKKVLVVTDRTLVEIGVAKEVTDELDAAGVAHEIFDGVQPNPTDEDVAKGREAYSAAGCDSIVALGGGSPMDAAKVIKIAVSHPGPLAQYDDAKGGDKLIVNSMPPLYAIATTAGTGSEVGRSALLVMTETRAKTVFFHPRLIPDIAVLEPKLTAGLPADITAATGVDAFVHSLEAYLATGFHPMADGIALEGMKLVIDNLPVAYRGGSDLEARARMLIASAMGATAFQKGLGMIHSLGHPLSARKKMHHGLACALMTPASLEFIEKSGLGEDDRKRLETVRKLFSDAGVERDTLTAACKSFMESLGIEFGLANHGVAESDLDQLAEDAFRDPCHPTNMVPVTKEDLLAA
ncbi:MAG: iron-containing alcohol dehydrogenase, partial [Planctomycetota bacterium]